MLGSHFGHLSPFVSEPHFLHFEEYPMKSFFPVFVYLKIKTTAISMPIAAAATQRNMIYLILNSIKN